MPCLKPTVFAVMIGTGFLMSGCMVAPAMTEQEQDIKTSLASSAYMPASREMRQNIETQELFAQGAFWSREYDLNPSDLEATIKLAAAVRKLGNPQRAIEITQTGRALYPKDPYLGAEFAAAMIAGERAAEAMPVIDTMLRIAPGYARLWSLKGAALDQTEQYNLARKHYARAMQITPHDPNILTNIGLSYALSGDPQTAEGWLRRAAAMPGATAAVQQNLALVLQLQGKPAESAIKAKPDLRRSQGATQIPQAAYQKTAPQKTMPAQYEMGRASSQIAAQAAPQAPKISGTMPSLPPVSGASYTANQNGQAYTSASEAARDAARRAAARKTQKVAVPAAGSSELAGGYPQGYGQQHPQQSGQAPLRRGAARRR